MSARLVAGGVVVMALVALVGRQHWLLIPLAYGFVARVLTGPKLSPLGQLVTKGITPRLDVDPRYVPGPPKRFAQAIGARIKTVRRHIANGEIRAEKLGNRYYIPASEVDRIFGAKDAA